MARAKDREAVYEAANAWRQNCLLDGRSVFTQNTLWQASHVQEVIEHFVDRPDTSKRSFDEKLQGQLSSAPPAASQLVAEMMWVMMLFPSNIGSKRKVASVRMIWGWSGEALPRVAFA